MSRSRHYAGESGVVDFTVYNSANQAVTGAALLTLHLTVRNAATGEAWIENLDCLTSPGNERVVYDSGTGGAKLIVAPDLTALRVADAPHGQEIHVAEITWTNTKDGRTETGKERHELICSKVARLALCTLDDVEEIIGRVGDGEVPKVETQIDDVTVAFERYCERWFAYKENEVELFSPRGSLLTLWVRRFPIVSVASLKESYDSDFAAAHASTVTPSDYVAFKEFGAVRLRWWRFSAGEQTAQLTYTGGLARETAGLPWDLREAAAQQAAYQYQRRTSLGTSGETQPGGGSVVFLEKDLLPSVKRRLEQFKRVLPPW